MDYVLTEVSADVDPAREPDLISRLQSGAATEGICIHCNRCMPTIYSGTRCVEWGPGEAIRVR